VAHNGVPGGGVGGGGWDDVPGQPEQEVAALFGLEAAGGEQEFTLLQVLFQNASACIKQCSRKYFFKNLLVFNMIYGFPTLTEWKWMLIELHRLVKNK
jgi:hypothetical protein